MDSNSLFNPIQDDVSPARHLARIKKNTSPLILPLNRRNDASAAIQCETIKISQSSLGTPCHKFQQILIILSAVTRPRTFPTEFHPIAAQLHVHRPARARNPEKLLSSSLKPTTRCVVVCCFRFVRPLLSDQTVGHYPPTVRLAFTDPLQCHSFPPRVHESVDPLFVNVAALLLLLLRPGRDNHPVIGPLLFLDDARARSASCVAIFLSEERLRRTFWSFLGKRMWFYVDVIWLFANDRENDGRERSSSWMEVRGFSLIFEG